MSINRKCISTLHLQRKNIAGIKMNTKENFMQIYIAQIHRKSHVTIEKKNTDISEEVEQ